MAASYSKPLYLRRNRLSDTEGTLYGRVGAKGMFSYFLLLGLVNEGYYLEVKKEGLEGLAFSCHTSASKLSEIINQTILLGIFDKTKYEKFQILTNEEIQLNHFKTVVGRKSENIEIRIPFLISSIIPKIMKFTKYQSIFTEILKNIKANFEQEKRELKVQNKDLEREYILFVKEVRTLLQKQQTIAKKREDSDQLKAKFKQAFPNKIVEEDFIIPDYVDMDKLIEGINNSPEFLLGAKNFGLKLCCRADIYEKIIAGYYDKIDHSSTKVKPAKETISKNKGRNYTEEQLDGLFDDMENIQL